MTIGPGKYDDVATSVREQTEATAVIVMIFGGDKGNGFSVQVEDLTLMRIMPAILRELADKIEQDIKKGIDS